MKQGNGKYYLAKIPHNLSTFLNYIYLPIGQVAKNNTIDLREKEYNNIFHQYFFSFSFQLITLTFGLLKAIHLSKGD